MLINMITLDASCILLIFEFTLHNVNFTVASLPYYFYIYINKLSRKKPLRLHFTCLRIRKLNLLLIFAIIIEFIVEYENHKQLNSAHTILSSRFFNTWACGGIIGFQAMILVRNKLVCSRMPWSERFMGFFIVSQHIQEEKWSYEFYYLSIIGSWNLVQMLIFANVR